MRAWRASSLLILASVLVSITAAGAEAPPEINLRRTVVVDVVERV
jgi:hypothetical protein